MIQRDYALPAFTPQEACVHRLCALYQRRGYERIYTPKFEDYALYLGNKNFLGTDRILSFTDAGGKLMALKPDVTLSIAKNIPSEELPVEQKLYYREDVVRFSPENLAYQVLGQVGLERIGREDPFANLEVLDLALRSLSLIGPEWAMDISHLGFVSGLLEDADLPPEIEREILAAIHAKSVHDVAARLEAAGVNGGRRERILSLADLHGPFFKALPKARELVRGERMATAYKELEALVQAFKGQPIFLDFSVVNHLDYYNGLIFRGYVKGVSAVVVSGGRYDNLMQRLGKASSALGFAVSLHRLDALFEDGEPAPDILLLYPGDCDPAGLLAEAEKLCAQGYRVRCQGEDSQWQDIPRSKVIHYRGGKPKC